MAPPERNTIAADQSLAGPAHSVSFNCETGQVAFEVTAGFFPWPTFTSQPKDGHTWYRQEAGKLVFEVSWLCRSPLFVAKSGTEFRFSHTIPQLLGKNAGNARRIDKAALRDFMRKGPTKSNYSVFENIATVAPGHRLILDLETGSTSVEELEQPKCTISTGSDLEEALIEAVRKSTSGKNLAVAISGGVDSTLLAALYRHINPHARIVAFTSDSGMGQDLKFAKIAAEALELELVKVPVMPRSELMEAHRAVTRAGLSGVPIIGNSIGFNRILQEAKEHGFSAILDGTGGDHVFGGNYLIHGKYWYNDPHIQALPERRARFEKHVSEHRLLDTAKLASITRCSDRFDYPRQMYIEATRTNAFRWVYQHMANSMASGVEIVMPFYDPDVASFISSPAENFFIDGWSKHQLRQLLEKYCCSEVAWRTQSQGLKIDRKAFVKSNSKEIASTILTAPFPGGLFWPGEKLFLAHGLRSQSSLKRIYAAAVLCEEIEAAR